MTRPGVLPIALGLAAILNVTGCSESRSTRPHHTVDYYRAHPEERRARFKICTNDPGALARTPDCVNALEADRLEGIGSFRNLPPMDMPPTPEPKKPSD